MSLKIVPMNFRYACQFINSYHRHHKAPQGHKFSIGASMDDKIVGVAICGRPVSRRLDNGKILEVTRLCTDGSRNVCSKLYSACARIAREMGYETIISYILNTEQGISLKASGWTNEGKAGGKSWNVPSRPRINKLPYQLKIKYCKRLVN